jgi:hypothetical protein
MQTGGFSEGPVALPNPVRIVVDPVTSLPVLSTGPDAPLLTSEQVEEILSGFP